jgi:3-oxoacyl-[acyl-carrier protein] reductase
MRSLDSQYVVVTGSSSGIGRAIAVACAQLGANVLVHGCKNIAGAEETAALVRALGGQSLVVMGDLRDEAFHLHLVQQAFQWSGERLTAWVHNAGVDVLTAELSLAPFLTKLDRLWEVDVRGTMALARLVAQRWLETRETTDVVTGLTPCTPSMIFIGWDQASHGMEGDAGQMFGAIKGAVMSFSLALAQSLAPQIRVNCVAPGWIQTEWGQNADEYWDQRAKRSSLIGRWGTPEDVAAAVVYLIGPAASFQTGQILNVNGGWNRRVN